MFAALHAPAAPAGGLRAYPFGRALPCGDGAVARVAKLVVPRAVPARKHVHMRDRPERATAVPWRHHGEGSGRCWGRRWLCGIQGLLPAAACVSCTGGCVAAHHALARGLGSRTHVGSGAEHSKVRLHGSGAEHSQVGLHDCRLRRPHSVHPLAHTAACRCLACRHARVPLGCVGGLLGWPGGCLRRGECLVDVHWIPSRMTCGICCLLTDGMAKEVALPAHHCALVASRTLEHRAARVVFLKQAVRGAGEAPTAPAGQLGGGGRLPVLDAAIALAAKFVAPIFKTARHCFGAVHAFQGKVVTLLALVHVSACPVTLHQQVMTFFKAPRAVALY
mmetsp:Transcript_29106/g.73159  ORF Transcript_29106/g.73159 Transcript_29106/m.73159 type:complete len:334 (-) Transcript_29106:282-1283(-)